MSAGTGSRSPASRRADTAPFAIDEWPYVQIADRLAKRLRDGEFAGTRKLPRQHDLARHYGVDRKTVAHAIGELEKRGLVTHRRGGGTYLP